MLPPLTANYQQSLKRTRTATSNSVRRIWKALPAYNEAEVKEFLKKVLPIVNAGQRKAIAQTSAYLSMKTKTPIIGLNAPKVVKSAKNDMTPEQVYRTPFIATWGALSDGADYEDAVMQGENEAAGMSQMDIALAAGAAMYAWGDQSSEEIVAWVRVAEGGACEFCQSVDGAHTGPDEPMPLHRDCGCTADPIFGRTNN